MPKEVTNEDFGKTIKEIRNKHHYSLRQVSYQSKTEDQPAISASYWSLIERGKRNIPKPETLKRMAKGLRIPAEELMKMAGYTEIKKTNKNYYDLSEKEKVDLGKLADQLLEGSTNEAESDFYGEPSTPEQKASLRAAILTALEMNKSKAKKKFTPKKYRDNNNDK